MRRTCFIVVSLSALVVVSDGIKTRLSSLKMQDPEQLTRQESVVATASHRRLRHQETDKIKHTFFRTLGAVSQVCAMAAIGAVFTNCGFIDTRCRRAMSMISMNVTIPCLLLSSILTCPKVGVEGCPSLVGVLKGAGPMIFFPWMWMCIGIACSLLVAKICCVPRGSREIVVAAGTFGNSTGLPLVLLSAIVQAGILETNLSADDQLRNFFLLLSVYQLTSPILQWTIATRLIKTYSASGELESQLPILGKHDVVDAEGLAWVAPNKHHWWSQLKEFEEAALVPPVIAVAIAVVIRALPGFSSMFVSTQGSAASAPLQFMLDAIRCVGQAAVPLNMLVLGSSFSSRPSFERLDVPAIVAAAISKMIVVPSITCGTIWSMRTVGLLSRLVPDEDFQYQLMVVACLVSATPTANNLIIMAEVSGAAECKPTLVAMSFLMYCVAPILLTGWVVVFASLNRAPGAPD